MNKRVTLWISLVLGLLLVGLTLVFLLSGQKAYIIKTPSMGQTAPVGSLVLSRPQSTYHIGDIVNFWQNNRVYTHRIVGQDKKGFITKGDMNRAEDPWRVQSGAIVAKVDNIIWYAGWIIQALPWLILGWLIVYTISCWSRILPDWRWPTRIMGGVIVIALISFWLHPWLNFGLISYVPNNNNGVDMHIVNTGIFPLKAGDVRLTSGEDATVTVVQADASGRFVLMPRPALGFWGVVWALLFCLSPLILSLLIRLPKTDPTNSSQNTKQTNSGSLIDRHPWSIICLIVLMVAIILTTQLSTLATFVGAVSNQNNSTATRTYFTCWNTQSLATPKPYVAYALSKTSTGTEADISGNGRTGTFSAAVTTSNLSTNTGCVRDTKRAVIFGGNRCLVTAGSSLVNPRVFSIEAWFQTSAKLGKIIGFGGSTGASDTSYDRHIYIDKDGRVAFGVNPGSVTVIASPVGRNYADGQWHHVIATLSSSGMRLYVDGELSAQNNSVNAAENYTGYWKYGCGSLTGWRNGDGTMINTSTSNTYYFNGSLQFVAAYSTALTATQVKEHYLAGIK